MGFKFHSPSFHMGGRKYRPSNTIAGLYVGVNSKGKLRGHWRSGWREHYSPDSVDTVNTGYKLRSIRALVNPSTSSARGLAGNYKNALRSTVYG